MVLLLEKRERLRENAAYGTAPHLETNVLTARKSTFELRQSHNAYILVRFIARPWYLVIIESDRVLSSTSRALDTNLGIMHTYAAYDAERADEIKSSPQGGGQANNLDGYVSPTTLGGLLDSSMHAFLVC